MTETSFYVIEFGLFFSPIRGDAGSKRTRAASRAGNSARPIRPT